MTTNDPSSSFDSASTQQSGGRAKLAVAIVAASALGLAAGSCSFMGEKDKSDMADRLEELADTLRGPVPTYRGLPTETRGVDLNTVYFGHDQSIPEPGQLETFHRMLGILKEDPDSVVMVMGCTDGTGSDAYNLRLSQTRAEVIAGTLVGMGFPESRVNFHGFGEHCAPGSRNYVSDPSARESRIFIYK